MADLVYVRRKAVEATEHAKAIPAGHAIGVDAELAKALLVNPDLEKCKSGDGWKKSSPAAK